MLDRYRTGRLLIDGMEIDLSQYICQAAKPIPTEDPYYLLQIQICLYLQLLSPIQITDY